MNELKRYKDIGHSTPDRILKAQEHRLKEHLAHCGNNSPYYKRLFRDAGIDWRSIGTGELATLPFTDKHDMERQNDDFLAVARSKIVDIVLSSGTTGRPIRMMYTDYDLRRLAYNEEQAMRGCGLSEKDEVLLTCTMDRCFVAGLAYFSGLRALGSAVIRNGHSSMESHAEIIKNMNPTAIVGVPSFLKKLGLCLREKGVDPGKTSVSKLVCIGEPLRDERLSFLQVGKELEKIWQAKAFSTYASSEVVTTFCECMAQKGGHLQADLAIVEIVDDSGAVLPPGAIGEVVMTPLAVEGMPLVRFKTGDVSFLIDEPCGCGRTSPRLGPILGRKKQMIKLCGTTLYPQAVFNVLEEMEAVCEYYMVVNKESEMSDSVTVYTAVKGNSTSADVIQSTLQARLRVKPAVVITDEGAVRSQVYTQKSRKPTRLIDKR